MKMRAQKRRKKSKIVMVIDIYKQKPTKSGKKNLIFLKKVLLNN